MSVMLKGTLLVPVENLQSNCNFMWVGTLNSSNYGANSKCEGSVELYR